MRSSSAELVLLVAVFALAGCHDKTPAAPSTASDPPPASSTKPAPEMPAPSSSGPAPTPHALKQHEEKSMQDAAQLDFASEGGVRGGSYAMWVHVSRAGAPVPNLNVVAFDAENKPVAGAPTNGDGDAMLKVDATTYRIAAKLGSAHAEQTVTYHPGDQFELKLRR